MIVEVGAVTRAALTTEEHKEWSREGAEAARFRLGVKREIRRAAPEAARIFILGPDGGLIAEIPTSGEIKAANEERLRARELGPGPR